MLYKNTTNNSYKIYGVTFLPNDVHRVDGFINIAGFQKVIQSEKPKATKEPIVSIPEQSSVEIKMNAPKKTIKRSSKKASTSKAVEETKIETDTAPEQVVETDNTEISKDGDTDTDGTN